MNIKKQANKLARFFQSRDPFEIIRGLNVILVYYPLDGVHGFYQFFQRNNIIYLDERLSDQDKRFVLAHELGHMYLHKKANAIFMDTRTQFVTSRYEIEADRFAMELLLSDDMIQEYTESGYSLEQIARVTGYQQRLIKLRVDNK